MNKHTVFHKDSNQDFSEFYEQINHFADNKKILSSSIAQTKYGLMIAIVYEELATVIPESKFEYTKATKGQLLLLYKDCNPCLDCGHLKNDCICEHQTWVKIFFRWRKVRIK